MSGVCLGVGKGAQQASRAHVHEGSIKIKLPENFLNVVAEYRHVGSMVSSDGPVKPDMMQRSKSALAAYVPFVNTKLFSVAYLGVSN